MYNTSTKAHNKKSELKSNSLKERAIKFYQEHNLNLDKMLNIKMFAKS